MKIAICDDDQLFTEILREKIEIIFTAENLNFDISIFNNSTNLIDSVSQYDMIFLDVEMPDVSGEKIAHRIIASKYKTLVIFVTNHDDFVSKSFRYKPFGFIRKNKLDFELQETIFNLKEYLSDNTLLFLFEYQGKTMTVKFHEIVYIEVIGHYTTMHTVTREFKLLKTLSAIEKQLQHKGFIRTHKSFLVNCDHIFSVEKNCVILNSGQKIPLSRHRITDVKETLITFSKRC